MWIAISTLDTAAVNSHQIMTSSEQPNIGNEHWQTGLQTCSKIPGVFPRGNTVTSRCSASRRHRIDTSPFECERNWTYSHRFAIPHLQSSKITGRHAVTVVQRVIQRCCARLILLLVMLVSLFRDRAKPRPGGDTPSRVFQLGDRTKRGVITQLDTTFVWERSVTPRFASHSVAESLSVACRGLAPSQTPILASGKHRGCLMPMPRRRGSVFAKRP
jgi:hypothetical protein